MNFLVEKPATHCRLMLTSQPQVLSSVTLSHHKCRVATGK